MESGDLLVCDVCHGSGTVKASIPCDHCRPLRRQRKTVGWLYACDWCSGTGALGENPCPHCGGRGEFGVFRRQNSCRVCAGAGKIPDPEREVGCPKCRATGMVLMWNPVLPSDFAGKEASCT